MSETKEKDYQISDLIIDACDEFEERVKDGETEVICADDLIYEIADQTVPIYYWDIAQYAAWNPILMQEIPDCGSDSEPYKQIQMNIYEAICEGLYEHINEKETEDES